MSNIQHDIVLAPLPDELQRLYAYADRGDLKSMEKMLKSGIPVNFIEPGTTDSPLMIACRRGFHNIVRICLDYGAKNDPHPEFGQTALHAAVSCDQIQCASVILDVAAESEADYLISNLTDQYGQTPLHSAATVGSPSLIELLIHHGAEISAVDSYGQTAIHISAGSDKIDCLAMLLGLGGDEIIDAADVYGNTALHHAAYHGRLECAKLLLETAANVSARNVKNLTPYNLATSQGHHQVGLILLEYRDHHQDQTPSKIISVAAFQSPGKVPQSAKVRASPILDGKSQSVYSTPMANRYERDYSTPHTSEKVTVPIILNSNDGAPLSKPVPAKRSQSHNSYDSALPRPHTVSSPSISTKTGVVRQNKLPRGISPNELGDAQITSPYSTTKSPADEDDIQISFANEEGSLTGGYRVLSQLSSPLLPTTKVSRERNVSMNQDIDSSIQFPQSNNAFNTAAFDNNKMETYDADQEFEVIEEPSDNNNHYHEYNPKSESHQAVESSFVVEQAAEFSEEYYYGEQSAENFADPLEVFNAYGRTWHVYMTETNHTYFLDIANEHSQWEDPRHYGIVEFTQEDSKQDKLPESPIRASEGAPPLSPAVKSSRSTPVSPIFFPAPKKESESPSTANDNSCKPVARTLAWEEEMEGSTTVGDEGGTPSSGLCSTGSILSTNKEKDPNVRIASKGVDKDSSSSDEGDSDEGEFTIRRIANNNRNGRRNIQLHVNTESSNIEFSKPPERDFTALAGKATVSSRLRGSSWIQDDAKEPSKSSANPAAVENPIESTAPEFEAKSTTSKSVKSRGNEEESLEAVHFQKYIDLVRSGKNLQEIRLVLEEDNKSISFINKCLSLADELLLDQDIDASSAVENSASAGIRTPKPNNAGSLFSQPNQSSIKASLTAAALSFTAPSLDSLKDDPLFIKYVKMVKMGVPHMSVITKMKMDCVDPKAITEMQRALGIDVPDPATQTKEANSVVTLESLKDNIIYAKYVKMAKMGVPPLNVISKMKMDGAAAENVLVMQRALGLEVPEAAGKASRQVAKSWQPIPEERLKNSIWASGPDDLGFAEQELKELEQMFAPASSKSQPAADKIQAMQSSAKAAFTLKLLEGKRAQNIVIGLVPFKSIGSNLDVIKAICSMNDCQHQLTADRLENFKTLLPSEAEMKLSFKLKQAMHPAEQFIQAALLFYPELPIRLTTFISCLNFPTFAEDLDYKLIMITSVINQVLSSPRLAKMLQKLLVVGKAMMDQASNQGSRPAAALKTSDKKTTVIEQLLQLSITKGVDKKTSVLDYLVKMLYEKNEDGVLGVIDDLAQLADNTQPINSVEIFQEYDSLEKQYAKLVIEQERIQPSGGSAAAESFASPTAKMMSDEYSRKLEESIELFKEKMSKLSKRKLLMSKKITSLVEYFGEDPNGNDVSPILIALREFRRELSFSKERVEWKLSRANSAVQPVK